MERCPECNSDDIILWDDGYICCDCGRSLMNRKLLSIVNCKFKRVFPDSLFFDLFFYLFGCTL